MRIFRQIIGDRTDLVVEITLMDDGVAVTELVQYEDDRAIARIHLGERGVIGTVENTPDGTTNIKQASWLAVTEFVGKLVKAIADAR